MSHPHASNIKILGIIHLIFGGLALLGVLVIVLFVILGAGAVAASGNGDPDAAAAGGLLALIGMIAAAFLALMSLPQLLGGWGLLKGKSWAKIVILIISALSLLSIPIGTALGIFGFWALLHQDADEALASLNVDADLYG